jgi:hypothetical protein
MNVDDLTVYKSPYPKLRIGKHNDGGYIIANIPNIKYSCLLSGGISNDISFEEEFIKKYEIECYAFDGTIKSLPKQSTIKFTKKNIGDKNDDLTTNIHEFLNSNENVFVKMDIEGGEFSWLKSLSETQMDNISQICIEFHFPFSHDIIKKFNNHVMIHFHGNNCCGTRMFKGVQIPNVFECTYIHKKYVTEKIKNSDPIPSSLDMPNIYNRPEIMLNFPPFVTKLPETVSVRKPTHLINGWWSIWNPLVSKS